MVEETEKTCFVIMPITTPDSYRDTYRDNDHFTHVGECLFKPAIEKAGFKPILPISKGSENIHANIIKKIEASDLVLCDMSILNPNVFFEFGIRTALNKPICLVKDEHVQHVPFDTLSINYHTYSSDLSAWIVSTEINKLAEHIKESYQSNEGRNPLWKHFGLSIVAKPDEKVATEDDKFDYINRKLDIVMGRLNERQFYSDNSRRSDLAAVRAVPISGEPIGDFKLEKGIISDLRKMLSMGEFRNSELIIWFTFSASGPALVNIGMRETEIEKMPRKLIEQMDVIVKNRGFILKLWHRTPYVEELENAYYSVQILI